MKKGGGIGPLKPWQPIRNGKGAKSNSVIAEKDKFLTDTNSRLFS